jgi:ATP-dependent RNA helicase DeaD
MDQFREGHINILVATDLAARGIDVKEISYVVITIYRMRMNLP